jgi:polar amino acid transport system substrate-binding protein
MIRLFALPLLTCLFLAWPGYAPAAGDPAEGLTYLTEEFRPLNYTINGKPTGLAVDLLKLLWQEMGVPEQPIHVMPWPRIYRRGRLDPNIVIFSMYRTKGREADFKWVGPIVQGKTEVFVLRSRHLGARSLKELGGWRLAAVRDVASADILRGAGLHYTDFRTPDTAIGMLTRGRVDAVAMDALQFHYFTDRLGRPANEFTPIMTLCSDPLYFAFSLGTPDALVDRFQKALDAVTRKPDYRNLLDQYLN